MSLEWVKCEGGDWCDLANVNLNHAHFSGMEGVYVIWHRGLQPATVRVGQGIIEDRLAAHRADTEVQAYASMGLSVTWASVSLAQRDGVEAYLATRLDPKVGERFPNRVPIQVNLPW